MVLFEVVVVVELVVLVKTVYEAQRMPRFVLVKTVYEAQEMAMVVEMVS